MKDDLHVALIEQELEKQRQREKQRTQQSSPVLEDPKPSPALFPLTGVFKVWHDVSAPDPLVWCIRGDTFRIFVKAIQFHGASVQTMSDYFVCRGTLQIFESHAEITCR